MDAGSAAQECPHWKQLPMGTLDEKAKPGGPVGTLEEEDLGCSIQKQDTEHVCYRKKKF